MRGLPVRLQSHARGVAFQQHVAVLIVEAAEHLEGEAAGLGKGRLRQPRKQWQDFANLAGGDGMAGDQLDFRHDQLPQWSTAAFARQRPR
jgi:hypothetical protein